MSSALRTLAALLLVAVLTGCAIKPQGTVVLLPDAQGKDTAVTVKQAEGELLLDKPYAAAQLTSRGPLKATASAEEVRAQFGDALAAQPIAPAQFIEGKDEFTDESRRAIDSVLVEIARRPVPDVLVIGHTDTVGTDAFNDGLSRQRGEVVRKALLARGIQIENVVVVGRGKREPIVPTADNVAEPRNRRVEILVR